MKERKRKTHEKERGLEEVRGRAREKVKQIETKRTREAETEAETEMTHLGIQPRELTS